MAFRRPVWFNTLTNSITDMSDGMIDDIRVRAVYLWSLNPSVYLEVVENNGNENAMVDTYRIAGEYRTSATAYPDTVAGETIEVTYDRISTTTVSASSVSQPSDDGARRFPVYRDEDNNLRAMTREDFYDTFIDGAVGKLIEENVGNSQAGTFEIGGPDDMSGYTNLGEVFVDNFPNVSAYTSGGIPEALTQTLTNSYHLHRRNWVGGSPDVGTQPLILTGNYNLKYIRLADLDDLLEASIRYQTFNGNGNRINYKIQEADSDGNVASGVPRGSAIVNTNTTEVDDRVRFVNADDYRAQEHPSGTPTPINTYYLTIERY